METAFETSLRLRPTVHFSWHWTSCGQTRPQTAGSREFSLMISRALANSPSAMAPTKSRMLMRTGQPSTHGALRHCRHRIASSRACSSV